LDCFNSRDGIGEFTGPGRYQRLQDRLGIAAAQSRTLFEFWATLSRRMRWPAPPKRMDEVVLPLLEHEQSTEVLRVLGMETASVVMLARHLHGEDKATRRVAEDAWADEMDDEGGLFGE
jgi:hypothetical protein